MTKHKQAREKPQDPADSQPKDPSRNRSGVDDKR